MSSPVPQPIRHILCPVDFSDCSELALTYACSLARRLGARVSVLHVYHLMAHVFPDDVLALPAEVDAGLRREAEKHLSAMIERCAGEGLDPEPVLVEGVPQAEIAREADARGVDLVVVGSHGRSGLEHLLIGSVAERVVRTSPVPVLTVRKPSA
jgi:nucleotide-binding universal stress UspA family protein